MTTVFGLFLIFCAYGGLGYVVVRVWRTIGRRRPWSNARGLTPTPRHLRPLEQWAFDFERDLIEAPAISSGQKTRASDLLSQLVVPLVGHVRLCDVDRDLEKGVASVLRAQIGTHRGLRCRALARVLALEPLSGRAAAGGDGLGAPHR